MIGLKKINDKINHKNSNVNFYHEIKKTGLALKSLSIYRNILKSNVMVLLQNLINYLDANTDKESFDINAFTDLYSNLYFELANSKSFYSEGNKSDFNFSLKQYVAEYVLGDENIFTKQAEKYPYEEINPLIRAAASNDLGYLQVICQISCTELKKYVLDLICSECKDENFNNSALSFIKSVIDNLPDWNMKYDIIYDHHISIDLERNYENTQNNFQGNNSFKENNNYLKERNGNESQDNNHYSSILEEFLSKKDWKSLIEPLARFHNKWGYGNFARFRAFVWYRDTNYRNVNYTDIFSFSNLNNSSYVCYLNGTGSTNNTNNIYNISASNGSHGYLKAIVNPDPIRLTDLIGYETQRQEVLDNTLRFLKGYPANNMLLYGDRGTGKSSTIKALVNKYYDQGLRLVEVPKKYLMDFPDIIRILEGRKHKFIIFIDDLAFEDNEENYTALKAILEGGVKSKPSNVIIYATSNRRHLIKEKFSDRSGLTSGNPDDEIHASDTIQEKLSLADRFGIKVTFSAPDKNEFLKIVEGIAEKRGIKIDKEYLHREALKWELTYNGRSPRTAKQFIDWLEGYLKMRE